MAQDQPNGISVLIAGAGIGGLMAALELWRKGCSVTILERAPKSITSGDSFTIGPSAINSFKNWPELHRRERETAYHLMTAFHKLNGERVRGPVEFTSMLSDSVKNVKEIVRHSRPKLHAILFEQIEKCGIDVEFGTEVVDYFEDVLKRQGGVVLKDGTRRTADLVVAADGLRSPSSSIVHGAPVPARSSGNATFRAAYPVGLALADPIVAERFQLLDDGRSVMEMWAGPGMQAVFWRNQDEMIWALNHPDHGTADESWSNHVDPEEALKYTATIKDWPEVGGRVIKATPSGILVDYKLMWRDPQEKWTSPGGYVVQLGDAAHTFLPSSGNGGTQAIEDAVSLAACVSKAVQGNVPQATRVHNLLRFERVSCLQALGVANREARTAPKNGSESKPMHTLLGSWLVEHDPEKYALDNYEKGLAHLNEGAAFTNTNTPPNLRYIP